MLVEKVTKNSIGEEIRTRLLEPQRFTSTSFEGEEPITGVLAHGFTKSGLDVTPRIRPLMGVGGRSDDGFCGPISSAGRTRSTERRCSARTSSPKWKRPWTRPNPASVTASGSSSSTPMWRSTKRMATLATSSATTRR